MSALKQALREHWLTGIACDPELPRHTDRTRSTCYCAIWRSEPMATVGEALEAWIEHLFSAIATQPPSTPQAEVVAPQGWKLVPLEPTAAMLAAYKGALKDMISALPMPQRARRHAIREPFKGIGRWRAMLAAAPSPNGSQHGGKDG